MTKINEPALDEPTLRAVIAKLEDYVELCIINYIEAITPKPESWAETAPEAWMSTQDLPSFDNYLDAAKHFARWVYVDPDRWPQAERAAHDPCAHADGSRECRPSEDANQIYPPLHPSWPRLSRLSNQGAKQ